MHKLLASAYKEMLLLIRDIGGIAILFVMPLILVVTITLIQDSTFKTIKDTKIPVLIVDYDKGTVAKSIFENLQASNSFQLIKGTDEKEAEMAVLKGTYQLAVIIPKELSTDLQKKVNQNVEGILEKFGLEDEVIPVSKNEIVRKEVRLYFDPTTQTTFKNSVKNGIDKMISQIETQSIYKAFQEQLGEGEEEAIFETDGFITFKEIIPSRNNEEIIPNSAQHNVPAWTLFAIFFIIVPLSINLVKEKTQGTFVRLRTNPVSYATVLGGKTLVYLCVCLIQFTLMLLIGVYIFPMIGLPELNVSGRLPLLYVVAIFAGLAAIGLGLLLGTIARTQEQSAPFGATFVVILAALGGVWVPVFIMPRFMQILSNISPMNWGLNGFYDVFLRNASFGEILPEITLLLLFFIITTFISIVYNEKKMRYNTDKEISFTNDIRVRFVETDPLGIVWHGNYIQYFEDGREAFGRLHGISYLDQKEKGYASPIVKSTSEHQLPLRYGDVATIKTIYVDSPAAKMIFRYEIYNPNGELVCTGETIQVFVALATGDLSLTIPDFFKEWKKKEGLLNE